MKILRALALVVGSVFALGALFESPESRERDWAKDPAAAFRRTWYFYHIKSFSPEVIGETTMLIVRKAEIEQWVGGKDRKGVFKIEESRTFKYSVRETGRMEDGSPYVEVLLSDVGAVWTAVLLPREKKMKLFKGGFYVGLYGVP